MNTRQTDIAPAHLDDAYRIGILSRDVIEHGLQWKWKPERIGLCILSPDTNVVVAKNHDQLIGFGIMAYGYRKAELNLLGVDPAWQAQGVGHSLLHWLEQCAQIAGLESSHLHLRTSNHNARKFYLRNGYTETGKSCGYYQQKEDALCMTKRLREGCFQG